MLYLILWYYRYTFKLVVKNILQGKRRHCDSSKAHLLQGILKYYQMIYYYYYVIYDNYGVTDERIIISKQIKLSVNIYFVFESINNIYFVFNPYQAGMDAAESFF